MWGVLQRCPVMTGGNYVPVVPQGRERERYVLLENEANAVDWTNIANASHWMPPKYHSMPLGMGMGMRCVQ